MGRFKDIDTEIHEMELNGFSSDDIAAFLNIDVGAVDSTLGLDLDDICDFAEHAADIDADFYGN
jgi:hypothetical protein